ncbi:MAG: hypothetical protein ACYCYO_01890 [Bacilli bacterium]
MAISERIHAEGETSKKEYWDQRSTQIARDVAARDEMQAAHQVADAEWTLEVTIARRQAWNDAVNALIAKGHKVTAQSIPTLESKVGFSWLALKTYVGKHGLK